ncbi:MAG: hypothetical protein WB341_10875 [Terracidiphilus sp.]
MGAVFLQNPGHWSNSTEWLPVEIEIAQFSANAVLQLVQSEATKAKWLFPQEKATLE